METGDKLFNQEGRGMSDFIRKIIQAMLVALRIRRRGMFDRIQCTFEMKPVILNDNWTKHLPGEAPDERFRIRGDQT